MSHADKLAEVRRTLDRYLVEVVEAYELCPWARGARERGELAVVIEFGEPTVDRWIDGARDALARGGVRVAMVVAPECGMTRYELAAVRDRVAEATGAGVAEFHPAAVLDLASAPRVVPFLRRAPDPLLQLVPLPLLAAARSSAPVPDRARQAAMLGGTAPPPRDVAATIAAANYQTAVVHHAAIERILADIDRERRDRYRRVGIRLADP